MASQTQIDQIAERVERLLVRYEELQRTNELLTNQVTALSQERDSLKSRLNAARARVDALLDRLPDSPNKAAAAAASAAKATLEVAAKPADGHVGHPAPKKDTP